MSQDRDLSNQMRAITISREYGSGGGEIAARLAKRLEWNLIDHAIVERIAQEMGTSTQEAEAHDENVQGSIAQILNSFVHLYPGPMYGVPPMNFLSDADFRHSMDRIVRAAASRGHVVIVGRASQVILADHRDVLHARIIAPIEKRIAYVVQREGIDRQEAEARIRKKDQDRARHLQSEYHRKPEDPNLYDLVINTSLLDLESAVDLVRLALQQKASHLSQKTGELGPVVGLPRYVGQPDDFRPSQP